MRAGNSFECCSPKGPETDWANRLQVLNCYSDDDDDGDDDDDDDDDDDTNYDGDAGDEEKIMTVPTLMRGLSCLCVEVSSAVLCSCDKCTPRLGRCRRLVDTSTCCNTTCMAIDLIQSKTFPMQRLGSQR